MSSRLAGLLVRFRVYAPKKEGRGFWDVLVFKDREALVAFANSDDIPGGRWNLGGRTLAFCRAVTVLSKRGGWRPRPRGSRGIVAFSVKHLGVRVASHEWTHAAHYELASHQGREPLTLKDDERLAYLQCELHARFWTAFHARFKQTGKFLMGFPVWRMRPDHGG